MKKYRQNVKKMLKKEEKSTEKKGMKEIKKKGIKPRIRKITKKTLNCSSGTREKTKDKPLRTSEKQWSHPPTVCKPIRVKVGDQLASTQCFFICFRETFTNFDPRFFSRTSGAILLKLSRFWTKIVMNSSILARCRGHFSVFRAYKTIFPLFLMIPLRKIQNVEKKNQDVLKKILKTKKSDFFSFKLK